MAGRWMTGKVAVLLALTGLMAAAQAAEDKPLWELGAGVAAFSFPSYRGSDQTNNFLLPVPHFTYHGKILKADRQGLRASLFDSDRVDLTISAALSPPSSSKDTALPSAWSTIAASITAPLSTCCRP